ncbi:hypothetical protein Tco_1145162 [Tanacetum coccineum]
MASTRASISKASKRPKSNIIPPKQLFVDLTQDDTKTPSPKHQLSSPSAPNAPSKTPSTKGTSSSSIDYTPKSPTLSTSPSPNSYLNSPTSPPPRVPPSLPTHEMHQWTSLSPFHQLLHLMSNLILYYPLHLSLVIPFLGTFFRHIETHGLVAFGMAPSTENTPSTEKRQPFPEPIGPQRGMMSCYGRLNFKYWVNDAASSQEPLVKEILSEEASKFCRTLRRMKTNHELYRRLQILQFKHEAFWSSASLIVEIVLLITRPFYTFYFVSMLLNSGREVSSSRAEVEENDWLWPRFLGDNNSQEERILED